MTLLKGKKHCCTIQSSTSLIQKCCNFFSPGISLSGPFLFEISVKSRRIRAAFLASDFRLEGIGLLTADVQMTSYHEAKTTSDMKLKL